jgi:hypothetical protein
LSVLLLKQLDLVDRFVAICGQDTLARAAGVPVIAVEFGYSERPVAEFAPDRTISHFTQLPASIAAISAAI